MSDYLAREEFEDLVANCEHGYSAALFAAEQIPKQQGFVFEQRCFVLKGVFQEFEDSVNGILVFQHKVSRMPEEEKGLNQDDLRHLDELCQTYSEAVEKMQENFKAYLEASP